MPANPFALPPKLWPTLSLVGLAVGFLAGELVEAHGLGHAAGMRFLLLFAAPLGAAALGAWLDGAMHRRSAVAVAALATLGSVGVSAVVGLLSGFAGHSRIEPSAALGGAVAGAALAPAVAFLSLRVRRARHARPGSIVEASDRAAVRSTALGIVALAAIAALPFGRLRQGVTLVLWPFGVGEVDGRLSWITAAIALACAVALAVYAWTARARIRRLAAAAPADAPLQPDTPEDPDEARRMLRRAFAESLIGCVAGASALALAIGLPLALGSAPARSRAHPDDPPADLRIALARVGQCQLYCPRFNLEIDRRGYRTINGTRLPEPLTRRQMKILMDAFERAAFFEMDDTYGVLSRGHYPDMQIGLRMNGREKLIRYNASFMAESDASTRLLQLSWQVNAMCGVEEWLEANPPER
jgi:hypothetical protein